ncbi:MAG: Fic family protein [Verrucomicrobia bacterium]|jgi:Fic family protein|nr:Fic family protein [Verrucomicrobiota bacterium]
MTSMALSSKVVQAVSEIERLIGRAEGLQLTRAVPQLRKKNRIRAVQGSTGIEGNTATIAEVEAIARGEQVALSRSEQIEVRNALQAYDSLATFAPFSVGSLLEAHAILMGNGLLLSPGHFRQSPVEVYVSEYETRGMPRWETVEPSVSKLFDYLRQGDDIMLLKSVRFHFEFVNIHPFPDGNGRLARLWQTRLLMEEHPIFEFLDVESMVFQSRDEYYRCIRGVQDCGNVERFCLFMLEQIRRSLEQLWVSSTAVSSSFEKRIAIARETFANRPFARQDYLRLLKTISQATASRDLASATAQELMVRTGEKRTATYRFALLPL